MAPVTPPILEAEVAKTVAEIMQRWDNHILYCPSCRDLDNAAPREVKIAPCKIGSIIISALLCTMRHC